ncbi:MAG: PIN domain-containing protein [Nocardioidaceae bacterium]
MTAPRTFVDTNVFVYAADESPEEEAKHQIAVAIVAGDPDALVLSTQILQEFYVAATRKLRNPLSEDRAAAAVQAMAKFSVISIDKLLVLSAVDTSRTSKVSLWDALVVEAARTADCPRLLTEDLSHGQVIRGVTVENPFLSID